VVGGKDSKQGHRVRMRHKVIWIRGWMISQNMTGRIFQAQTGVRLLYPPGSLVGKARCKEARSHQQRARTDWTILDLHLHFQTSTSTSTLTLTLLPYRINPSPEAPIQDKRHLQPLPTMSESGPNPPRSSVGGKRKLIEEQTAGQLLHTPSELAVERHLPQSPTSA
jgi:hypothetical protein